MATITPIDGFITLDNIINNFLISYTGPGKLIPDAKRTEVVFHARRCLQEFAYETLKSQFDVNLLIPNTSYVYTLPKDNITLAAIYSDTRNTVTIASTIGTVTGDNPYTATITTAVSNGFSAFLVGDIISGTNTAGTFGTGPMTVTALNSTTSISVSSPTVFTAGTVTVTLRVTPLGTLMTDITPPGGGTPSPLPALTEYYVTRVKQKQTTVVFGALLTAVYNINIKYLSNALTNDETALIPKLAEEALYSCMAYAVLANRESTNPNVLQRLLIEKIDKLERSKSRLIFTNFT